MEETLAIVKPDAVAAGFVGKILSRIEEDGFRVRGLKMVHLREGEARLFYGVHRGKPFYESLVAFMTSGPVVAIALEREDGVAHWRRVMGVTDPASAAEGTLRSLYGTTVQRNAVHGSDSVENGVGEINFFFNTLEKT